MPPRPPPASWGFLAAAASAAAALQRSPAPLFLSRRCPVVFAVRRHLSHRSCTGGGDGGRGFPLCPTALPVLLRSSSYATVAAGPDDNRHRRRPWYSAVPALTAAGCPDDCSAAGGGDGDDSWDSNGRGSEPVVQYLGREVGWVARAVWTDLVAGGAPEPEASTAHLLAHALHLPWDDGYRRIQELLQWGSHPTPASSDDDNDNDAATDDAAALSAPPLPLPLARRKLTGPEAHQLSDLVKRRLAHEPIQYLVGQWDFLDATYAVRAPLLCPRPETEELVLLVEDELAELCAHRATRNDSRPLRVLDVGCGTGCIGISLLDRWWRRRRRTALTGTSSIPLQVHAIDNDPIAVETSLENARRILGPGAVNGMDPSSSYYSTQRVALQDYHHIPNSHRFDLVVSNPPYIPLTDQNTLEPTVLKYESVTALFGGTDGMDVIRDAVRRLPTWCRTTIEGTPGIQDPAAAICWMEVDPSHPALLEAWLTGSCGGGRGGGDGGGGGGGDDNEYDAGEPAVTVPTGVQYAGVRSDLFGRPRFVRFRVRGDDAPPNETT